MNASRLFRSLPRLAAPRGLVFPTVQKLVSPASNASVPLMRRFLSAKHTPSNLEYSKLTVELTKNPKPHPPHETLVFGHTFTDHMLEVDWDIESGWGAPRITPFHNLELHPAISSLHYAIECFEGMKAYIDSKNGIRMFRPMKNMDRMNSSTKRLVLPQFDGQEFVKCIEQLLVIDKHWIPKHHGYSLYIRPTCISTHPFLGVAPSKKCKLFVICSPVGPYYKEGFKPVKLYADERNVRAWPGGVGNIKCGGNYAMGIQAQITAAEKGYAQVMWLFGQEPDQEVTEVGTMNQFFFWRNEKGEKELITAPLDGTILPGVTRDSILQLARGWKEFQVSERPVFIREVIRAVEENRMIEAFGAGTAAIVSPVSGFYYKGKEYPIPLDGSNPSAQAGPLTHRIAESIMDIQYGVVEHEWSWPVDEKAHKVPPFPKK